MIFVHCPYEGQKGRITGFVFEGQKGSFTDIVSLRDKKGKTPILSEGQTNSLLLHNVKGLVPALLQSRIIIALSGEREGEKMPRKVNNDYLNCARKMPRLRHTVGDKFDIRTSEVVKWLLKQPDIAQKIFNFAMNAGVIVYDPYTGEWRGADVL